MVQTAFSVRFFVKFEFKNSRRFFPDLQKLFRQFLNFFRNSHQIPSKLIEKSTNSVKTSKNSTKNRYRIQRFTVLLLSRWHSDALSNLRFNVAGGASSLRLCTNPLLRRLIRLLTSRRDPFRLHPPLAFGSVAPRR